MITKTPDLPAWPRDEVDEMVATIGQCFVPGGVTSLKEIADAIRGPLLALIAKEVARQMGASALGDVEGK